MYRYTRRTPLETGQKYGDIVKDGDLPANVIERFLASGTLARMELPPLAVLPDSWQERRELLAGVNIFTIGDLLGASERELSKKLRRTPKTIRDWKMEAERWLNPDPIPDND